MKNLALIIAGAAGALLLLNKRKTTSPINQESDILLDSRPVTREMMWKYLQKMLPYQTKINEYPNNRRVITLNPGNYFQANGMQRSVAAGEEITLIGELIGATRLQMWFVDINGNLYSMDNFGFKAVDSQQVTQQNNQQSDAKAVISTVANQIINMVVPNPVQNMVSNVVSKVIDDIVPDDSGNQTAFSDQPANGYALMQVQAQVQAYQPPEIYTKETYIKPAGSDTPVVASGYKPYMRPQKATLITYGNYPYVDGKGGTISVSLRDGYNLGTIGSEYYAFLFEFNEMYNVVQVPIANIREYTVTIADKQATPEPMPTTASEIYAANGGKTAFGNQPVTEYFRYPTKRTGIALGDISLPFLAPATSGYIDKGSKINVIGIRHRWFSIAGDPETWYDIYEYYVEKPDNGVRGFWDSNWIQLI